MSRLTAAALSIALAIAATPAAAQVTVTVEGVVQEIPANTVRTVTTRNGRTSYRDAAWSGGEATPGMAAITTTETTEEDDAGRVLSRTVVTRIEPQRAMVAVVTYAPPPPPAPRLEVDAADLDEPTPMGTPRVLRLKRDSWGGHFVAPVLINGVRIRAIIDTGASYSILSADDARATGADRSIQRTEAAVGIGGYTQVGVARVASVEVAGQNLGRMTMRIGQPGLTYTLLGQTEIARLGRVTIEDGIMTITPRGLATQMAMR